MLNFFFTKIILGVELIMDKIEATHPNLGQYGTGSLNLNFKKR